MAIPLLKASDGKPSASFACGVYQIINKVNGKIYIGSSNNLIARHRRHMYDLFRGKHHNTHLQKSYEQYGKDAILFQILEYTTEENMLSTEQVYLDALWDGGTRCYNMAKNAVASQTGIKHTEERKEKNRVAMLGNKNRLGVPNSEETREKLSKALKGRVSPNKGVPMSEEQKKKVSIGRKGKGTGRKPWNKGKSMSLENRKKSGFIPGSVPWNKGKALSLELREKLSKAHLGHKISDETKKKIKALAILREQKKREERLVLNGNTFTESV